MVRPSVLCSRSPGKKHCPSCHPAEGQCSLSGLSCFLKKRWQGLNSELFFLLEAIFPVSPYIFTEGSSCHGPARTSPVSGSLSSLGCLGTIINQIHLGALRRGIVVSSLLFPVDGQPPMSTAGVLYLRHTHRHLHAPEKRSVNKPREGRVKMSRLYL